MDLKEVRKRLLSLPKTKQYLNNSSNINNNGSKTQPSSLTHSFLSLTFLSSKNITKTFYSLLIICPLFIIFALVIRRSANQSIRSSSSSFADARVLLDDEFPSLASTGTLNASTTSPKTSDPKLLNGLLSSGFEAASCIRRYQSYKYRKSPLSNPSNYLLSKLRTYENLHRQCGPGTKSYNEALSQLQSTTTSTTIPTECKYIIWIAFNGLGNKILTITAAFLYALLTDRVLLIDPDTDMSMPDLFCEPFGNTSWILPRDFPLIRQFKGFNQESPQCYGNIVKNGAVNASTVSGPTPSYLYLHMSHHYNDYDKQFFCNDDQNFLTKVPWLIMKTDNYFVPSLLSIPSFQQEIYKLFPEKATIFHHLGRYLFHPTNQVWGLITRYYNAYLSESDQRIGIQIRTFKHKKSGTFEQIKDQIISCLSNHKILPDISKNDSILTSLRDQKSISVLVTSLNGEYYESLREMYWKYATIKGEVVSFNQPSHEEHQQHHNKWHNRKAWAEMYLLSLSDKLVTSTGSTFGYVAQGLGGLRPWILKKYEGEKMVNGGCVRGFSIEPCFHSPPYLDCKAKTDIGATGKLVKNVRHCEDVGWGLKVVDDEF